MGHTLTCQEKAKALSKSEPQATPEVPRSCAQLLKGWRARQSFAQPMRCAKVNGRNTSPLVTLKQTSFSNQTVLSLTQVINKYELIHVVGTPLLVSFLCSSG